MYKVITWCLPGLLLLTSPVWSQDKVAAGTEKAVAALEQQWLQSQRTNNAELLVPLLADKFVNTGSDGKVTCKTETVANAKGTKWITVDYKDLKVTSFGSAAIAVGEFVGKGTDDKGQAIDEDERFTDTWAKMPSGKWQCVASQGTPIKK